MEHKKDISKKSIIMISIIGLLSLALLSSIFTKGFTYMPFDFSRTSVAGNNYLVLNDNRCTGAECDVSQIIVSLSEVLPNMQYTLVDYNTKEGKDMYNELGLKALPAIIFPEEVSGQEGYETISPYLSPAGDYLSLQIGATHNPEAEICSNSKDDNGDNLIDCADPTCLSEWVCMPKLEKPQVELFVMSYCPYGTQMQKAIIPVMEALGNKADIQVKFVDYIMHGAKEIDENLVQYCIQKDQSGLYLPYIKCFLQEGKSDECLSEVGIDLEAMSSCIQATDSEYSISELYNDKSTWNGGQFPQFNVNQDLNEKYGVRGSPTLIINGVTASVSRTPAALLDAVCYGFSEKPGECGLQLSTEQLTTGFGFSPSGSGSASGGCEV